MAAAKTAKGAGPEPELKKMILEAAVEVFTSRGYQACRIAEVAKRAGVGYGLVYHYFASKEALLRWVFDESWRWFYGELRASANADRPIAEVVHGLVSRSFQAYRDDPRTMKVLLLAASRAPAIPGEQTQSELTRLLGLLVKVFTRAIERGELRSNVDPRLLASQLYGSVEMGLASFVTGFYDASDDAQVAKATDHLTTTFLHGVVQS